MTRLDRPPTAIYHPDLSFYEGYIKKLCDEAREGFVPAIERMNTRVPRFAQRPDEEIQASANIEDGQLVYAREHGFEDWSAFCRALEEIRSGEREAHSITFGHAVERNDPETVRACQDRHQELVSRGGSTDKTPLHAAPTVEMVELLIERGRPGNRNPRSRRHAPYASPRLGKR